MQKRHNSDANTDEEEAGMDRGDDSDSATAAARTTETTEVGLVTKLTKHDVLMGRGAPSAEYEGNSRLRQIVTGRRIDYVNAPKRKDKHRIAVEIIETVYKNEGRFLRRVEDGGKLKESGLQANDAAWELVTDRTELLSKVKQLLRDIGPQAREKRAARRQERKQNRDGWSAMGGKETQDKVLDSSDEGKSHSQAFSSSLAARGERTASTTVSTTAASYASLAQQQAAAFGSGPSTANVGRLSGALQTYPGSPLTVAPPPNQSGLLREMTEPHILPGPFTRSMLSLDLRLLQTLQASSTSAIPHYLLDYRPSSLPPSSSMMDNGFRQRQGQLTREILLLQQSQQQPIPHSLLTSLYGGTGVYAASPAQQDLSRLLRQQGSTNESISMYQLRQQQRQEHHISQLLGRPATTTTTATAAGGNSIDALSEFLAQRSIAQPNREPQRQVYRGSDRGDDPDSANPRHQSDGNFPERK